MESNKSGKTRLDFEHGLSFLDKPLLLALVPVLVRFAEYLAPRRQKVLLVDRDQSALEQLAGRFKAVNILSVT